MTACIDTHCHLASPRLASGLEAVLARAKRAGVDTIIAATATLAESRQAADIARRYTGQAEAGAADDRGAAPVHGPAMADGPKRFPSVYCLAGVHPHDAREVADDTAGLLAELEQLLANPRCVGVGEIGLDYHYDYSPRPQQRQVFARQLELARRLGRTVVVHTREAFDETLAILADSGVDPARVVLHSFTDGPAAAEQVIALGMTISFSGIVTFASADALRQAAALVPAERLLTETDAPYLCPEPVRKMKTNEPANVVHVAAMLARVRNVPLEELTARVRFNAQRLFGIR